MEETSRRLRLYQTRLTFQEIAMRELIDWIDRELARLGMVIEGSEWGVSTVDAGKIAAEKLPRTDPTPAVLKAALGDCD